MSYPEADLVSADDGRSLALTVYRASGVETGPTVLLIDRYHLARVLRGPESLPRTALIGWIDELNLAGFHVAFMDTRGAGSSSGTSRDWFDDRLTSDVAAVAGWIRARSWSTGWLAAAGRSWSGTAALIAASELDGLFQAVCAEMCPLDLRSLVWPSDRLRHGFVYGWADRVAALDCVDLGVESDDGERARRAQHSGNADPVGLAFARWRRQPDEASLLASIAAWRSSSTPVLLLAGWLDAFVADMTTLFETRRSSAPWHLEIGPWSHLGMSGRALGRLEADWLLRAVRGELEESSRASTRLSYGAPCPRVVGDPEQGSRSARLPVLVTDLESSEPNPSLRVGGAHSTGRGSRWHNAYGEILQYPDFRDSPSCRLFMSPPLSDDLYLDGRPRLRIHVRSGRPFTVFAYLVEVEDSGRTNYVSEGQLAHDETDDGTLDLDLLPISVMVRRGRRIAIAVTASDTDNTYETHDSFELLGGATRPSYLDLKASESVTWTKGARSSWSMSLSAIQATPTVLPPGAS